MTWISLAGMFATGMLFVLLLQVVLKGGGG